MSAPPPEQPLPVTEQPPASTSRAGRNLPVAIGVGAGLGALVLASLFVRKEAFLGVAIAASGIGVWELRNALAHRHMRVAALPILAGAVAMILAAYLRGGQGLTICFGLTCIAVLLWRVTEGVADAGAIRDITGGVFVAAYVPLLASFTSLLLAEPDGPQRIVVLVLLTVLSDVGGYAVGVLAGRHPMSPSISPKKSWEGFAGSVLTCVGGGALTVTLLLHGPWWAGALAGGAAALAGTAGDLTESTVKRDLGIKDMGSLLPGHGGVMDRLDSLLLVAPVVWALLTLLVAVGR